MKSEAERRRVTSQREVDELTRQKDNISSHLAQVRQLLGGQMGLAMPAEPQVTAAPAKPALAESAPATPAPARPAGNGPAGPNGNGTAATVAGQAKSENEEDWWTE